MVKPLIIHLQVLVIAILRNEVISLERFKEKEKYLVAAKEEEEAFDKWFNNQTASNLAKYQEAIRKTRRLRR